MKIPVLFPAPPGATPRQRANFRYVQIDAIGIGIYAAAVPFLSIFLARLGATSFQVGLLTSIPALAGFVFGLPVGRFLQSRRNIVPWFSAARLLNISSYALTGLLPFFLPQHQLVSATLWIQAAATIPQSIVFVAFSVVMNAVAGPEGRYDLMSRRWTILGLTTGLTAALAGQVLDRLPFPLNYQVLFLALSLGGWLSYAFSSRIQIPDTPPTEQSDNLPLKERLSGLFTQIRNEKAFVSFASKRFIYQAGIALAVPIFPLYYVYSARASDAWIGLFNTARTVTSLIGYPWWARESRKRGGRPVLLYTTFGLALYPALTALGRYPAWIALQAGVSGFFQAGLDLVFFDELMRTVPMAASATFVATSQSLQHSANTVVPLIGTALGDQIGLAGILVASTALRMLGVLLFLRPDKSRASSRKRP